MMRYVVILPAKEPPVYFASYESAKKSVETYLRIKRESNRKVKGECLILSEDEYNRRIR